MTPTVPEPPVVPSSRSESRLEPIGRESSDPRGTRLPWPSDTAFLPVWLICLGGMWWAETLEAVRESPAGHGGGGPALIATLALAARVLGTLSEAGVYVLWWRSRGTPLPYWRFATWIAALSILDLVAATQRRAAEQAPEAARLVFAILAGPATLEPPGASAAMAAFGSVGLLTLLRVAGTGWAAARGTGRALAGPILIVAGAWLLTRLTGWWTLDLARGVSPLR
jgi:hypothetical protein